MATRWAARRTVGATVALALTAALSACGEQRGSSDNDLRVARAALIEFKRCVDDVEYARSFGRETSCPTYGGSGQKLQDRLLALDLAEADRDELLQKAADYVGNLCPGCVLPLEDAQDG